MNTKDDKFILEDMSSPPVLFWDPENFLWIL